MDEELTGSSFLANATISPEPAQSAGNYESKLISYHGDATEEDDADSADFAMDDDEAMASV